MNTSEATTRVGPAPTPTTRIPATSGPTNVPAASPRLATELPATSSPGVRASDGSSAFWIGRTSAPADAPTAASTKTIAIGAPTRITAAHPTAAADRTRFAAASVPVLPIRAAGTPASGPTRVVGQHPDDAQDADGQGTTDVERDHEEGHEQDPVAGGPGGPRRQEPADVAIGDRGPDRAGRRAHGVDQPAGPRTSGRGRLGCTAGQVRGHSAPDASRRVGHGRGRSDAVATGTAAISAGPVDSGTGRSS